MKKLLHLLSKQALMWCLFLISGVMWGQVTTYTHTIGAITWTNGQSSSTATLNSIAWLLTSTGGTFGGYDGTKGHQFGSGSTAMTSAVISTSGITGTVTAIRLSSSTASSGTAKISSVTVGGEVFSPTNQTLTTTNTIYNFTGSGSGQIIITWKNTYKAFYLKKIEVDYTVAPVESAPTVTNTTATNISTTAADFSGNVTATGGSAITANGSVYAVQAMNPNPQIGGTGVTNLSTSSPAAGIGTFSNPSGAFLSPNVQ